MSRSQSPYAGTAALMPLEDAPSSLLRDPAGPPRSRSPSSQLPLEGSRGQRGGGASSGLPAAVSGSSPPPVVTSASADFQRSLLQQQLQQSQKELQRLKEELYEASGRLSQTTTKLNEQKLEYGALTHRYANAIEKLTNTEGDVKRLEEQLVQERTRGNRLREEADELKLQLRAANEEAGRLQRALEEQQANRGLDRREVQRLMEDRTQFVPAVEVQRMQVELQDSQQSLVDRLTRALDGLAACGEEEETNLFVARSAVLSAATDLEARVLRAETALDRLRGDMQDYRDGLEGETNEFLLALMAENKELWQHLTRLQADHDVALSELTVLRRRADAVPAEQHRYVQRQLENMTERLGKAQQVMAAQTALAREHEQEMQELMATNAALEEKLAQLTKRLGAAEVNGKEKSDALSEADAALKDATEQIRTLQEALVAERQSADETVRRLNDTHGTMQREFEQRLRSVQAERAALEQRVEDAEKAHEDGQQRIAALEKELAAASQSFEQFKRKAGETATQQQERQEAEMAQAQQAMERELRQLHEQLEAAAAEARAAIRERDDSRAETSTLQATVRSLEAELSHQRGEVATSERQLGELQERLRAALAERDELKTRAGVTGMTAKELEKQIDRLTRERAELAQQLKEEQQRGQQRYEQAQKDWRASEKARTSLQEELKLLRMHVAEMETARQSYDRNTQDREHLMKENLRLHEQYAVIQQENTALSEELKALKVRHQSSAQLAQQIQDLQHRLRELPQLRQATDDARRQALKAREETEVLRKERDEMAAKLDYFLEESRAAAQMDEAFDKAVRDAGETVKRLGGQVHSAAKTRGAGNGSGSGGAPYGHEDVFTGARGDQRTSSPFATDGPRPRTSTSPLSGLGALPRHHDQQQRQRSPVSSRDVAVLTREAAALDTSSRSTPQRPWRA